MNKGECSNSTFIGFNHLETQSNFMISKKITLQNNFYLSKGFKMLDVGVSYRINMNKTLSMDFAPGISYGDMNFVRERNYVDGGISPGYSDNIGYTKTERISYKYYRAYVNSSLLVLFKNNFKLFIGARFSCTQFEGLDYYFSDVSQKYSQREEVNSLIIYKAKSLVKAGIEPCVSFHIPYKQVGIFFQLAYYGYMGNYFNVNTNNIMSRATIPFLVSTGFTLNPHNTNKKQII